MTFSHYAGVAIVPTLSRIVLAAVFITQGWLKFQEAPFTAEQAAKLDQLGVKASPKATPVTFANEVQYKFANLQTQPDDLPPDVPTQDHSASQAPEGEGASAVEPPSTQAVPATSTSPATADMYTARRLHQVTLMLQEKNWPAPAWMAWLAAITELVGGALLAIGLFSRVWGLGLAIAMGVALYLVSLPELQAISFKLFAMDPLKFSTFGLQAALFVLAFGIFLTGAGPLSLDRFLFAPRHEVVEVEVEKK